MCFHSGRHIEESPSKNCYHFVVLRVFLRGSAPPRQSTGSVAMDRWHSFRRPGKLTSVFKITRRDLLTTPALLAMQGGAAAWYDRPMRWGQLTLVENDPPKLDVGYWLDCFKRCRCD